MREWTWTRPFRPPTTARPLRRLSPRGRAGYISQRGIIWSASWQRRRSRTSPGREKSGWKSGRAALPSALRLGAPVCWTIRITAGSTRRTFTMRSGGACTGSPACRRFTAGRTAQSFPGIYPPVPSSGLTRPESISMCGWRCSRRWKRRTFPIRWQSVLRICPSAIRWNTIPSGALRLWALKTADCTACPGMGRTMNCLSRLWRTVEAGWRSRWKKRICSGLSHLKKRENGGCTAGRKTVTV